MSASISNKIFAGGGGVPLRAVCRALSARRRSADRCLRRHKTLKTAQLSRDKFVVAAKE